MSEKSESPPGEPARDRSGLNETKSAREPVAGAERGDETHPSATDQDRTPGNGPPLCDLCGSLMIKHHCKLACPNCGYMRDCSDP